MRLSVRYDNKFQIIELNEKETEEMWISLSLEGDELPNSVKTPSKKGNQTANHRRSDR